jgi:hypothetical protein
MTQDAQRRFFESLGEGPWTVVYEDLYDREVNMGVYCALSDPERRGQALASPSWDLTTTDGAPGFVRRYPDGVETTTYLPIASAEPGIEPLVLVRSFHGAHEATVELDQQFRLFHNLVYNPVDGNHLKPLDDGNELLAVKVEGNRISVRTSMLRQYLAARQMDLLLFIDSRVHSTEPADLPERKDYGTDRVTGNRYYGKLLGSAREREAWHADFANPTFCPEL